MNRVAIMTGLGVLALVGVQQLAPSLALAKEFEVDGTLVCGARSGKACDIQNFSTDPVVQVLTQDESQSPQLVTVDLSWVKNQLNDLDLDQDHLVHLMVRDDVGPTLMADGVIVRHGDGTDNQGLSSGNLIVPEQNRHQKKKDDH